MAQDVIKTARSASDPGPSGVPYSIYKRCPKLLHQLWKILRVMWGMGELDNWWRYAEGIWIPKDENAKEGRGDLAVLWLDLTNTYGSTPYKLVEVSLQRHYVPRRPST